MTAAPSVSAIHQALPPHTLAQGALWRIPSQWDDTLADKVVRFIANHGFEFYANGIMPPRNKAQELVTKARAKAEAGIPFRRYPVLDHQENVIGEFAFGASPVDRRKLEVAGRGLFEKQSQGIGREILHWCLQEYVPQLHQQGVRFPIFAQAQEKLPWKDRKVAEELDLKDMSVIASVHPDHQHCIHLLEKTGFTCVKEITIENFVGIHDGCRKVYEIALKQFIPE